MKLPKFFFRRASLRPVLRELCATGVISVYRSHSLLRLWEPLREPIDCDENYPT